MSTVIKSLSNNEKLRVQPDGQFILHDQCYKIEENKKLKDID